jgi:hypothetical protein
MACNKPLFFQHVHYTSVVLKLILRSRCGVIRNCGVTTQQTGRFTAAVAAAAAHQFGASAALGSLNMLPQLKAWCLEV